MLQIPCVGSEGLNAIVCFDGERFDPARAEAAVVVFAAGLERERLEGALASMRAERARSERLVLLGRAAGGAAHDLNNVLTAILGYADLLELEQPAAGGQAELEEIRGAVARGAGLVEELLAFGRPRAAFSDEVDLAEVLGRLAGMARRVAGEAIALDLRLEPGLGRVRIDREAFERAVLNLVANARHAIEARPGSAGRIAIALELVRADRAGAGDAAGSTGSVNAHGEWVRLSIADDGCGMPADVANRIFEPFFTTRATSGGTGLGLAGVAECVRRAGGRIAVESAPDSGTTLRIDLPTAPARPRV
jgi:signal transduction histidine kinase